MFFFLLYFLFAFHLHRVIESVAKRKRGKQKLHTLNARVGTTTWNKKIWTNQNDRERPPSASEIVQNVAHFIFAINETTFYTIRFSVPTPEIGVACSILHVSSFRPVSIFWDSNNNNLRIDRQKKTRTSERRTHCHKSRFIRFVRCARLCAFNSNQFNSMNFVFLHCEVLPHAFSVECWPKWTLTQSIPHSTSPVHSKIIRFLTSFLWNIIAYWFTESH